MNFCGRQRDVRHDTCKMYTLERCAVKLQRRSSALHDVRLTEATIVPGHWIIKGGLSLADITVAPYMFRLSALGSDQFWHPRLRPNVSDWYERLSARPAFRVAVLWPDESGGGYEEVGLQTSLAG